MGRMDRLLAGLLVKQGESVLQQGVRSRFGFLAAWVGILGNVCLFLFKLLVGLWAGSIALIADAFHSLSDVLTSIIVLIGFKVTGKPPDSRHPFGHGRAEPIATLIIAIFLAGAGAEFIRASIERLREPAEIVGSGWAIGAVALSMVIKELMARFSFGLGSLIRSDALKADAWHHRSDAISSGLVIVAMIGAMAGYLWMDGLLGAGVALIICLSGLALGKSAVKSLMGEAPSGETVAKVKDAAMSVRGVKGVHDVEIHDYSGAAAVVLHIEVAPDLTTEESHAVANGVEEAISRRLSLWPVVHVDLRGGERDNATRDMVSNALPTIIDAHPQVEGFHGLAVFQDSRGPYVEIHIEMQPDESLETAHQIGHRISEDLSKKLGGIKVNAHMEPAPTANDNTATS